MKRLKLNIKVKGWLLMALFGCIISIHGCLVKPDIAETEIEQKVFSLINQHRLSLGLNELAWHEAIAEECRIHSKNMADGVVPFGHEGFYERIHNIRKEIAYLRAGENLAWISGASDPASYIVNEWLGELDHRHNIEGDFNMSGVGVAKERRGDYYITQIFIKSDR